MPNYQDGKIYTIRCRTDNSLIYVGSTTTTLSRRLSYHRMTGKTATTKFYLKVNSNWEDWYIELHEGYPCNSKEELCKREGEVIREIGTLNSKISGRTQEESKAVWRENNYDKYLEGKRKWQENNRDKHLESMRKWRENNRDKWKESMRNIKVSPL